MAVQSASSEDGVKGKREAKREKVEGGPRLATQGTRDRPGWRRKPQRRGGRCGGVANVPSLRNQRAGLSWRPPPLPAPFHQAFNEGPGRGGGGGGRLGLGRDPFRAQVEQSQERVKVMR